MLKNYTRVVGEHGTKYYVNDKEQKHRLDGPAFEQKNGTKLWWINDKSHKNIDPTEEFSDGAKFWCFKNKLHRIGGMALDIASSWYIHNKEYAKKDYYNIVWDI